MLATLSQADFKRLAQIVRDETGNHVQEKHFSMLESRIRGHLIKLGLRTMEEYWNHFQTNEALEREVLQGLMTTHYTYFFREYVHFEVLERWLQSELPRLRKRFESTRAPVRIWSAAASRGQEVYSLAMFLETNLFDKYQIPFEVVGTDIDAESIAYAKNGVYPLKEVNTIPQAYLNRFWRKGTGNIKDFAAVHPNLKARTRFEALNLLEAGKWSPDAKFDAIFCRNVFIYFSEEKVRQIALDLKNHVEPGGLFVSGMSEPLRFAGWDLTALGPSAYGLPLPASATNAKPVATAKPSPAKTYRVLCVDDSATIQMLIRKIFSRDPACERVDVAVNGRDARDKLDLERYDLVTLDIHMPEVNGIEFLERLYRKKSDPPVLMISSVNRTDLDLATRAVVLGAFDYVEKPAMNNLEKSGEEIRIKAQMAMRRAPATDEGKAQAFDVSIGQKIVIPDASTCLRIVYAAPDSLNALGQVLSGHKTELRSPPTLVIWDGETSQIESGLKTWSERATARFEGGATRLRPNQVYFADKTMATKGLADLKMRSLSLQILSPVSIPLDALRSVSMCQVLLAESLQNYAEPFERDSGLKVSDITPSTSFPSLSVEFFANLRKAAA